MVISQAYNYLNDRWEDDAAAFRQLKDNFIETRGGIIISKAGYTPTEDDLSALLYLTLKYSYTYLDIKLDETALAPATI